MNIRNIKDLCTSNFKFTLFSHCAADRIEEYKGSFHRCARARYVRVLYCDPRPRYVHMRGLMLPSTSLIGHVAHATQCDPHIKTQLHGVSEWSLVRKGRQCSYADNALISGPLHPLRVHPTQQ